MKTRNASAVWLEKYNHWQIKGTLNSIMKHAGLKQYPQKG